MKLFVIFSFALAVAANPVVVRQSLITIPVARHINVTNSTNILKINQARAKAIRLHALAGSQDANPAATADGPMDNAPVTNDVLGYTVDVSHLNSKLSRYLMVKDSFRSAAPRIHVSLASAKTLLYKLIIPL